MKKITQAKIRSITKPENEATIIIEDGQLYMLAHGKKFGNVEVGHILVNRDVTQSIIKFKNDSGIDKAVNSIGEVEIARMMQTCVEKNKELFLLKNEQEAYDDERFGNPFEIINENGEYDLFAYRYK